MTKICPYCHDSYEIPEGDMRMSLVGDSKTFDVTISIGDDVVHHCSRPARQAPALRAKSRARIDHRIQDRLNWPEDG